MYVKNSINIVTDTSNPYYVYHSDQPKHLFVPEKLNGSNYPTWLKLSRHINCCVVLLPNGCILRDLATGRIIGLGGQQGDLNYMKPSKKLPDSFHVSSNTDL